MAEIAVIDSLQRRYLAAIQPIVVCLTDEATAGCHTSLIAETRQNNRPANSVQ